MDPKERQWDTWENPSTGNDLTNTISSDHQPFTSYKSRQHQQKWQSPSVLDYEMGMELSFQKFHQPSDSQTSHTCNSNNDTKIPDREDGRMHEAQQPDKIQDWDPRMTLNDLSFLEQKIHQLQDLVHVIVGRRGQVLGRPDELVAQQQQLITADLTSIIAQLISTAGNDVGVKLQVNSGSKLADQANHTDLISNYGTEHMEEHETKDEEDADEGENLPPGSYEILQLEKEEILAPHTHFCAICGKGFKRDANLRMHMRGHGDEYKTAAALAKPNKESSSEPTLIKRYSCPYAGCKRNKDHKKFQPLKTILCVKNHYKRTHCDKSYTCSRCNSKKFSVIADLKTHEKHCGKDKWLCSCGTTFSRKDKLFGHIALFQGHTPAIPPDEPKGTLGPTNHGEGSEASNRVGSINFSFGSTAPGGGGGSQNLMDMKESIDDPTSYFSPLNFETCNFDGFHELPRPPFEDSEISFLMPVSCNYTDKTGGESNFNNLQRH
ncbi:unnamed protein product [Malus baccata var. baccata]